MAHLHLICLVLLVGIAVEAAVLVEHSLDAGLTFSTAGRILLDEADGVTGTFERQPISSAQLSQLQQLVESDRWGALLTGVCAWKQTTTHTRIWVSHLAS